MITLTRRLVERYHTPLTVVGGAVLGVAIVLLYLELKPPQGRFTDADARRVAQERIDAITPAPPREPEIFATVRPSIVTIRKEGAGLTRGIGAGVVFDANGGILTAYHVVVGVEEVTVRFFDGTTVTGRVGETQPERDLAIVEVGRLPPGVQPAVFSGGVRQGARVLAIGAPFGLGGSVSGGIVSALGRRFRVEETGQVIEGMIQFDVAVNPGNSGGPLVDRNGHVVGIVSGIINPTNERVFIGIGFAVPIEAASGSLVPF